MDFLPRWRRCLGDYNSFAVEEPRYLFVTSGHAPPIGKWYVTGEK